MSRILSLLSSGRDSMLTTCRIVESNNTAYMIHFDNGCISHPEYVDKVALQIRTHYPTTQTRWLGSKPIMPIFQALWAPHMQHPLVSSASKYGNIPPYQLCCLCCRTAMYVAAIAIAQKNNIKQIADGARFSQHFINQQPSIINWYETFFAEHGIKFLTPVFHIEDDAEIIQELAIRGFHPKTLEAKCWLGFPAKMPPTEESIHDGLLYLQDIKPLIEDQIERYRNILTTII